MRIGHLVRFIRSRFLTVDYDVYRVSRAHFSHFSFITEMDYSLVLMIPLFVLNKLSLRTFYEFDITLSFYCRCKSFESRNSPKFKFVKSRKLSDLCSKIYEKSLN